MQIGDVFIAGHYHCGVGIGKRLFQIDHDVITHSTRRGAVGVILHTVFTYYVVAYSRTSGGYWDTVVLILPRFDAVMFKVVGASGLRLKAGFLHIDALARYIHA